MDKKTNVSTLYWIIASVAIIWNLMGLYAFYTDMTMTPETLAAMEAGQRSLYENFPMWKKSAYGVATLTGFLGSLGLVLRKSWAVPVLLLSVVGVVVQTMHTIFMTNAMDVMGPSAIILPLVILGIATFLYFFARNRAAKGILS
ncbi:MAG: hypothetical protein V3V00_09900 [Saprospiraceae bacterium]